jgi:hypothetical protein
MDRLSPVECFNAKPGRKGRDRMLGDGDGLFLRIRAQGTRTWAIDTCSKEHGARPRSAFSIARARPAKVYRAGSTTAA